jgi:hypothetical protein
LGLIGDWKGFLRDCDRLPKGLYSSHSRQILTAGSIDCGIERMSYGIKEGRYYR